MTIHHFKRMTALLTTLVMLLLLLPANTVWAENTATTAADDVMTIADMTIAETDAVTTTVGDTKYIYIAAGRQMLVTKFNGTEVTDDDTLSTNSTNNGVAKVSTAYNNGTLGVLIEGVRENSDTTFALNGKTYTVRVVPKANIDHDISYSVYVNAVIPSGSNCSAYFAFNGGTLYDMEDGINIDQTFVGSLAFNYFAAPADGAALSEMGASGSSNQFYALGKTVADSQAWPYDSAGNLSSTATGFYNSINFGCVSRDELYDLFKRAIDKGCTGAAAMNRGDSAGAITSALTFTSLSLPSITAKTEYLKSGSEDIEKNWTSFDSDSNVQLSVGDTIKYSFTIDTPDAEKISFTKDITFSMSPIGQTVTFRQGNTNGTANNTWYVVNDGNETPLAVEQKDSRFCFSYSIKYTIKDTDIEYYTDGKFKLYLSLGYEYKSKFGTGTHTSTTEVDVACKIEGAVSYSWGKLSGLLADTDLPEGTKIDKTKSYTVENSKHTTYKQINTNADGTTYVIATHTFTGWQYTDRSGNVHLITAADLAAGDVILDTNATAEFGESVVFEAQWETQDAPKYSVSYTVNGVAPTGFDPPKEPSYYFSRQNFQIYDAYQANDTVITGNSTYVFSGWKLNGGIVTGQQTMGEGNVELVGTWVCSGALTVTVSAASSGQAFLFRIQELDSNGDAVSTGLDATFAISEGKNSIAILGLNSGTTYQVTMLNWSWRYGTVVSQTVIINGESQELTFSPTLSKTQWLDGNAELTLLSGGESQ